MQNVFVEEAELALRSSLLVEHLILLNSAFPFEGQGPVLKLETLSLQPI